MEIGIRDIYNDERIESEPEEELDQAAHGVT